MFNCKFCKKDIKAKAGLTIHERNCKLNPSCKEKKYNCEFCNEECRDKRSLQKHYKKCKLSPQYIDYTSIDQRTCSFCNKSFKTRNAKNSHLGFCDFNPKKTVHPGFKRKGKDHPMFGKKGNNQFTKNPNLKMSEETKNKISEKNKNQNWSKERLKNHSKIMKETVAKNPESYCHGNKNGRTKIYELNGFKLRGTWELEVAKYLTNNKIKWTNKIQKPFSYIWNNSERMYFPDFYLKDYNVYIEVKGFKTERDDAKWNSVDNLIVLMKNEINQIKSSKFNLIELLNNKM